MKLKTYSPVDGSLYVERSFATTQDIESVVTQAQVAQKLWRRSSIAEREEYCTAAVAYIVANKEAIALELSWQMGRPIRYTQGEIDGFEERAKYMIEAAKTALAPVALPEKPGFIRYIEREPLGVQFLIAPWNYPFLTAVNVLIPSIMAGNAVVFKSSTQTPLVAEWFAQAFKQAHLPEGVFHYLHLTHEDTEHLIKSMPINAVAFTGSVAGGALVERAAAGRFIQVGLELGGKDPAYVCADADLEQAVDAVVDGAFFNSGQSCCGIERVYVHQDIYEEFLAKAVTLVNQYQLGRPDDPRSTLGPMVCAEAADFVRAQIKEALEQGAKAHINSQNFLLDKPGSVYLAPQILTEVRHDMRLMNEETFGPVIGIMKVSHDQEAVALMNDSQYGLTAALFTQDIKKGIALGEQIHTGTFFINRCDYLDPGLAWTGVKNSGKGCTLSALGYENLTRPKSFHIKL